MMKEIMYACHIFDPFFIDENSVETIELLLVDDLTFLMMGFQVCLVIVVSYRRRKMKFHS